MHIFSLRRRDIPWEVVDCKVVQSVPTFYDDEDVDIIRLSAAETRGTYVFELRAGASNRSGKKKGLDSCADAALGGEQGRKALIFARQQLLAEVAKKDYNVLLHEGWSLTVFRSGKKLRVEVIYSGRGALAAGKPILAHRQPPFMELLGPA